MELLRGWRLGAVATVLTVLFAGSAWLDGELTGPTALGWVLANTAPLLLVARNPLAVVLTFAVTYPLWLNPVDGGPPRAGHVLQSLPTLVALYATGAWQRPLWVRALGLVTPAWMVAAATLGYWETAVDELVYIALVFLIVWGLGVVDARRRSDANALKARSEELAAARHALADRAVQDERTRIARELHDVVAHAMSVITVQAGVGAHLLDSRPQRAAEALHVIERTGREALEELRRMLLVLRPEERALAAPQPGLAQLAPLLDNARTAGLSVTLTTSGPPPRLPLGLDLAVYRVVQECLTNAVKHAPGSRVQVRLRTGADAVTVDVWDTGPGCPGQLRYGHGLTGMAERVSLYDGTLTVSGADSGFRVTATFPLDGTDLP